MSIFASYSHLDRLVFTSKTKSSSKDNIFIPKELSQCSYVWLRVDRVKQPLEAPYSGPHEEVSFNQELKTTQIKVKCLDQTVSIQRLKPCKLPLAAKKSHQPNNNAKESPTRSNGEKKLNFQGHFCLCNELYNRAMLKCNKKCLIKWFHLDCVGLKAHPKGSWFCSMCKSTLKVKHVRIESEKLVSN